MTDHKTLIRQVFDEVVNRGKIELVDDLFDPDFQTITQQGTFDREGFKDYVRMWLTGFPDAHCQVDDLIVEGDRVAWTVRATGTHTGEFMGIPPTGKAIDFESFNIGEMRNGRAYRHKVLQDTLTMLQQLGVIPPPTQPQP
ncbi:MAG: ester cyclase [Actinomycetota bacterium]|nr:ester cyclase [Actinomycetota bacterium]